MLLKHVGLACSSEDNADRFYRDLLGLFVSDQIENPRDRITHQCIEVENLTDFIVKCRAMGVEVSLIPKGDKTLTFIKDFDGNLFELIE